jgi:hypothetical protein
VVNTLITQYRSKPVVFVEHDVDGTAESLGNRKSRWAAARGPASSYSLPMVMTDSGFKYGEGSPSGGFDLAYKRMVDASLDQPPEVAIQAYQERVGIQSALRVYGTVTNIGSKVLGYDNSATINIIVYEPKQVIHINNFVRKAIFADIDPDLEPGQTYSFDMTVDNLGRANMTKVRAIVLVDYRPGDGSVNGYVSANAALASTEAPPPPTEEPTEEATEVPTEVPTATSTLAPTEEPTAEPTEQPTEEPTAEATTPVPSPSGIYLPYAKKNE